MQVDATGPRQARRDGGRRPDPTPGPHDELADFSTGVAISHDNGVTWTFAGPPGRSDSRSLDPSVAIDAANKVYLIWLDGNTNHRTLHAGRERYEDGTILAEATMKPLVTLALLALLSSGAVGQEPSTATVICCGFGPVAFLRFSPDGRELERVCVFGGPFLFDTGNYNKGRSFPVGPWMVAYSPDGTRIATAEGHGGARVWDAALQGKPIPSGLEDAKLPNDKRRAGLVLDLREMDTPLHVLQTPGPDQVLWTEFSPDGQRLLTTHKNGHVKVWNTSSWNLEADFALTQSEVHAAAFAPDGNSLVIGDIDGVLHQWSFPRRAEVKTTRTTLGAVTAVAFSPDGKTLVTTHARPVGAVHPADGRHATEHGQSRSGNGVMIYGVMIWNTDTWIAVTRHGFGAAAFSKDGKILALGGENIELIDPMSQKPIRTVELPQMTLGEALNPLVKGADKKIPVSVEALAFSPDGGTLAAGCWDGTVRLVKVIPAG
jgi:WD40 repeat protein